MSAVVVCECSKHSCYEVYFTAGPEPGTSIFSTRDLGAANEVCRRLALQMRVHALPLDDAPEPAWRKR